MFGSRIRSLEEIKESGLPTEEEIHFYVHLEHGTEDTPLSREVAEALGIDYRNFDIYPSPGGVGYTTERKR